jgi:acetylornithine deacetylase/succinyl-diaminopimelate desuccinylase-like protein
MWAKRARAICVACATSIGRQPDLAGRIAAHIVLDGAGAEQAVTQALGSRRFRVTVTGPGGHSFTDAGTPNPIAALASALALLARTPLPGAANYAESGHHSWRDQRERDP